MVSGSLATLLTSSPPLGTGLRISLAAAMALLASGALADALPRTIEAIPPTYRKVTLSGRPLSAPKPFDLTDSDSEPEETFVDPLSLRLQNRTTEIYIPVGDTELAITVNRNIEGSAWQTSDGITPAMRPDLPFGDCWSSGLAANVKLIHRGEAIPVGAVVTDEEGTTHRFAAAEVDGQLTYIPLPNSLSQQDFSLLSLKRSDTGEFVFTRKFGNKVTYAADPSVELNVESGGARERHSYFRMNELSDRFGATIKHVYSKSNHGLIPDKISYGSHVVSFIRNELGCVSRIVDPAGFSRLYHYRESKLPGGAPLLIRMQKQITGSTRPEVTYEYDEASAKDDNGDEFHFCNISEITSRKVNTYRFTYSLEGHSQNDLIGRRLESVILPGKFGTVRHFPLPDLEGEDGNLTRRTFVADAEGNGVLYEFSGCRTLAIEAGGRALAKVAVFDRQSVTYFKGNKHKIDDSGEVIAGKGSKRLGTETFSFDVGAGGSLLEATDMRGNTTSFAYEETFPGDHFASRVDHPLTQRYSDPTSWTTPLKEKTQFEYSARFRLPTKVTDPLGRITVHRLSGPHEVRVAKSVFASKSDFEKNIPFSLTESEFSDPNHPGFETRKIVRKTSVTPEEVPWEVDLVEAYKADKMGRRKSLSYDPDDVDYRVTFTYDRNGNTRSKIYASGYRIDFKYDAVNHLTAVFEPANGVGRLTKKYIYGKKGQEAIIETDGTAEKYDYDRMGRKTEIVYFDAGDFPNSPAKKVRSIFNSTGSEVKGRDESGYNYTIRRDALQRATLVEYDDDTSVHYSYEDSFGSNLFGSSDFEHSSEHYSEDEYVTHYVHDANDRLTASFDVSKETGKELSRTTYEYDAVGNVISVTESEKGKTRHFYDALDRRIKTIDPEGNQTLNFYTSTGLKYATVEPDGTRTDTEYDSLGDPVD